MQKQRSVPWVVVLLGFWLGRCSALPAGPETREERSAALTDTRAEVRGDGLYWWYVRFRMAWPEGEDAPWHPDLGLADRVRGPVLEEKAGALTLWRPHRRAARDGAGRPAVQFHLPCEPRHRSTHRLRGRTRASPWIFYKIARIPAPRSP